MTKPQTLDATGRTIELGSWIAFPSALSNSICVGRVVGWSRNGTVKSKAHLSQGKPVGDAYKDTVHYTPGRGVLVLPLDAKTMAMMVLADFQPMVSE